MKILFFDVLQALKWSFSLGKKFFRVVPGSTAFAVSLTILSQLFLLIGIFLPLKVVLLLGSDHIPTYFPGFLHSLERDWLIVFLSVTSIFSYLLHLLSVQLVDYSSKTATVKLLIKSNKIPLFENQDDIALKGYQRYSQSLASFGFVLICLFFMFFYYPLLVAVIGGYFLVALLFTGIFLKFNRGLRNSFSQSLGIYPKIFSNVGFFIIFSFIVFDFLSGGGHGVTKPIISLLLTRQLLSRVSSLIKDLYDLYGQKSSLSTLFFHSHYLQPDHLKKTCGAWALIEPVSRNQWIHAALQTVLELRDFEFNVRWINIGIPDVICYLVAVRKSDGYQQNFLIKMFNLNRKTWAKHEATLLTEQRGLPTLPFSGTTLVNGMSCHIFDTTGYSLCNVSDYANNQFKFREHLTRFEPPNSLVNIYFRSRPRLWQRLNKDNLKRLEFLLEDEADSSLINQFSCLMENIQKRISNLPLVIQIPDIQPNMLWQGTGGDIVLGHWSRWELEPIGSKWPIAGNSLDQIKSLLEGIASSRPTIKKINLEDIWLSVLFSEFELRYQRTKYAEAYAIIKQIIDTFSSLSPN